MRAGKLRRRVEVQTASEARTGAKVETTYTTEATVWASVVQLSGARLEKSKAIHSDVTTEVRLRYYPGLTSKHRIKYGTRYLYPVSPPINVDDRNQEHVLLCKESDG